MKILQSRKNFTEPKIARFGSFAVIFFICLVVLSAEVTRREVTTLSAGSVGGAEYDFFNTRSLFDHDDSDKKSFNGRHKPRRTKLSSSPLYLSPSSSSQFSARELLSASLDLNKVKVHKINTTDSSSASSSFSSSDNLSKRSTNSTIVTAFFFLNAKHSMEKYKEWMANLLSVQDNMVIFTEAETVPWIIERRQHSPTVVIEMTLNDLPIRLLGASNQDYNEESEILSSPFWKQQLEIDRERKLHKDFRVFWIWLSKSWWTVQAIQMNWLQSDFFMWVDVGSFRDRSFHNKRVIEHPDIVPTGTILWMAHHSPNPPPKTALWTDYKKRMKHHFYHSGSQAAGYKQAWLYFHQKFADTVDGYIRRGQFIGEDQCVLQATCLLYPRLCAYSLHDQVKDNPYFGLRYVLRKGGKYFTFWRPPVGIYSTSRNNFVKKKKNNV